MNKNYIIGIVVVLAIIVFGGFFVLRDNTEDVGVAKEPNDGSTTTEVPSNEDSGTITEEKADDGAITESKDAAVVIYTNSGFSPFSTTIQQGQTVTWVNESSRSVWVASAFHPSHTVYPEKSADDCLGSAFDTCRRVSVGESWSFTFDSAGSWKYHNHLSPSATGVVVVE